MMQFIKISVPLLVIYWMNLLELATALNAGQSILLMQYLSFVVMDILERFLRMHLDFTKKEMCSLSITS